MVLPEDCPFNSGLVQIVFFAAFTHFVLPNSQHLDSPFFPYIFTLKAYFSVYDFLMFVYRKWCIFGFIWVVNITFFYYYFITLHIA